MQYPQETPDYFFVAFNKKLFFCNLEQEWPSPPLKNPSTTTAVYVCMSRSGYHPPPLILKRDGLKSAGRRLISSNGKTKRKAFFGNKKLF